MTLRTCFRHSFHGRNPVCRLASRCDSPKKSAKVFTRVGKKKKTDNEREKEKKDRTEEERKEEIELKNSRKKERHEEREERECL